MVFCLEGKIKTLFQLLTEAKRGRLTKLSEITREAVLVACDWAQEQGLDKPLDFASRHLFYITPLRNPISPVLVTRFPHLTLSRTARGAFPVKSYYDLFNGELLERLFAAPENGGFFNISSRHIEQWTRPIVVRDLIQLVSPGEIKQLATEFYSRNKELFAGKLKGTNSVPRITLRGYNSSWSWEQIRALDEVFPNENIAGEGQVYNENGLLRFLAKLREYIIERYNLPVWIRQDPASLIY